jgi:hypothetical protein
MIIQINIQVAASSFYAEIGSINLYRNTCKQYSNIIDSDFQDEMEGNESLLSKPTTSKSWLLNLKSAIEGIDLYYLLIYNFVNITIQKNEKSDFYILCIRWMTELKLAS